MAFGVHFVGKIFCNELVLYFLEPVLKEIWKVF